MAHSVYSTASMFLDKPRDAWENIARGC